MPTSSLLRAIPFAALAVSLLAVALPAQASDRLTAGQYEFTATTDGQARNLARCVSADEARNVNADTKTGREMTDKLVHGTCTVTSYEADGNTVSMSMTCGEGTTSTRATYHGDSWSADTTYTFPAAGGKTAVKKTHVDAKRVGDCK